MPAARKRKGPARKHDHYLVQITYKDKEVFRRVCTNKDKAKKYAERQRKSPVVRNVTVRKLS